MTDAQTSRPTAPDDWRSAIDWRAKGFPVLERPIRHAEVAGLGWNLFDGRALLPTMVLRLADMEHDIALMADHCARHGIVLAPHGKTSMAPDIFQRQLAAGAWAITLATPWQARAAAMVGVPRILVANEVVDPAGIAWLASTLDRGWPEVWCWVDSVAGVDALDAGLRGQVRRLPVCIEVGVTNGRAGVRTFESGLEVARRVRASGRLRLAGVASYEGVAAQGLTGPARAAGVDDLLVRTRQLAQAIDAAVADDGGTEIVITAGGSEYPDHATAALAAPLGTRLPSRGVLRSGAYVTHDVGGTDLVSPFGSVRAGDGPRLRAALEVWASVLSVPEPGVAIVGAGRRDLPSDGPVPVVLAVRDAGGHPLPWDVSQAHVTRLNDQHAILELGGDALLQVGDLVAFGVHHACTAFDRWRWIAVVDAGYDVVDAYETVF